MLLMVELQLKPVLTQHIPLLTPPVHRVAIPIILVLSRIFVMARHPASWKLQAACSETRVQELTNTWKWTLNAAAVSSCSLRKHVHAIYRDF